MNAKRINILAYLLIAYMLIGLSWWSVLLYRQNEDMFELKVELQKIISVGSGQIASEQAFYQSSAYKALEEVYIRKRIMIVTEAGVIVLGLFIGFYLVSLGLRSQLLSARQQRNFLLSITHELKSPIASIRLALETILKRDQLQREHIKTLSSNSIKEADRLHGLVNDILLAARLETSDRLQLAAASLHSALQTAVDQVRQRHPSVMIDLQIVKDLPIGQYDEQALESVLVNLLENAIKYSPSPAQIRIETEIFRQNKTKIRVIDYGFGVPDKEKKRIFDKFYRIGNEDTRQTKGTGLGLYIVKRIIESHGGSITVTDNKPQGSIFTITI